MKNPNDMSVLEMLLEVETAEIENGCEDRGRLDRINRELLKQTGRTAAALLAEAENLFSK